MTIHLHAMPRVIDQGYVSAIRCFSEFIDDAEHFILFQVNAFNHIESRTT
ncbi:hypothetical protein X738_30035 [Mesorhizobium sp. LNHC209A00]|nr:hypothetical protein X738_30035 [Mesorhizobium sp. LNHC209A00]